MGEFRIGDWGLGIADWGSGIGDWGFLESLFPVMGVRFAKSTIAVLAHLKYQVPQSEIRNPKSEIRNPQSEIPNPPSEIKLYRITESTQDGPLRKSADNFLVFPIISVVKAGFGRLGI
ncbi:MAG TPA: hypothetical protein VMX74_04720 [Pirellulales bacterium]|nr:hypothetical protein [Pirellulales bacterium]